MEAFEARLRAEPDAVVLRRERGVTTREDVDRYARVVERAVREARIVPGSCVGFAARNGVGFLGGLVGVLRAEVAPVLLDPRAPDDDVARIVARLGLAGVVRDAGDDAPPSVEITADEIRIFTEADRRTPTPPAVVKLTSGSTGEPAGIVAPVAALLADDAALRRAMSIGPSDRLLAAIPFSHSYGLSSLVVPALVAGIELVLPTPHAVFDPARPLRFAEAAGATVFPTAPAFLSGIVRVSDPPPWPASLRRVISAGARLAPEMAARFRERFDVGVHAFYGASECGGIAYDPTGTAAERGAVGIPIPGVDVLLEPIDGADGRGEGPREPSGAGGGTDLGGRVAVRSAAVARGYLPESSDRLGNGRFVTDDIATWTASGELALSGRLGRAVNVRGRKVEPAEIERVLEAMPSIDDVHVYGAVDGANGEPVVRAVVACPSGGVTVDAVRAWCRERLADHKVPRGVRIVERLPRTARGKLDRAAIENGS